MDRELLLAINVTNMDISHYGHSGEAEETTE